jgi:hypothetical protein
LLSDANGEAVAVFVVVEDAIHRNQELVTLRPVPAFYHDEADLHSFVIEDDVLDVSNPFVLRPINIGATYVGNVRGKTLVAQTPIVSRDTPPQFKSESAGAGRAIGNQG